VRRNCDHVEVCHDHCCEVASETASPRPTDHVIWPIHNRQSAAGDRFDEAGRSDYRSADVPPMPFRTATSQ
jgi:hypothetical protein